MQGVGHFKLIFESNFGRDCWPGAVRWARGGGAGRAGGRSELPVLARPRRSGARRLRKFMIGDGLSQPMLGRAVLRVTARPGGRPRASGPGRRTKLGRATVCRRNLASLTRSSIRAQARTPDSEARRRFKLMRAAAGLAARLASRRSEPGQPAASEPGSLERFTVTAARPSQYGHAPGGVTGRASATPAVRRASEAPTSANR